MQASYSRPSTQTAVSVGVAPCCTLMLAPDSSGNPTRRSGLHGHVPIIIMQVGMTPCMFDDSHVLETWENVTAAQKGFQALYHIWKESIDTKQPVKHAHGDLRHEFGIFQLVIQVEHENLNTNLWKWKNPCGNHASS